MLIAFLKTDPTRGIHALNLEAFPASPRQAFAGPGQGRIKILTLEGDS
jgi:hypothetical protein